MRDPTSATAVNPNTTAASHQTGELGEGLEVGVATSLEALGDGSVRAAPIHRLRKAIVASKTVSPEFGILWSLSAVP